MARRSNSAPQSTCYTSLLAPSAALSWSGIPTRARPQHVDFYNYESCKSMYKSFATAIITRSNTFNGKRYKDDPTIMAWSIINEPRCVPADARG